MEGTIVEIRDNMKMTKIENHISSTGTMMSMPRIEQTDKGSMSKNSIRPVDDIAIDRMFNPISKSQHNNSKK